MATYRYLFADLLSGRVIEELPVDVSSFSRIINGVGSLSATLNLSDLRGVDWRAATRQRATAIYVERDGGPIVWGGIIWKRRPVDDGRKAQIDAATFESYFAWQRVPDLTATGLDAWQIILAMIASVNAHPNGDVRVTMVGGLTGQTHTISYLGDERKKMLDEWQKLAAISPGFEFTVEPGRDANGDFSHTLRLAAPQFAQGIEPIMCEFPGNVASYEYPEDESGVPTALTGVGAGEGSAMLSVTYVDFASLDAGYPWLEDELIAKEETSIARLGARTAEKLGALRDDATVPQVTLRGDAEPTFGSYPLGVQARLRATSLYHPATATGAPGLDVTRRVTGWTVAPAQAGRQEHVTLNLGRLT